MIVSGSNRRKLHQIVILSQLSGTSFGVNIFWSNNKVGSDLKDWCNQMVRMTTHWARALVQWLWEETHVPKL